MKKLLSTLLIVFFATSMIAQTGLSCEDPIQITKDYQGKVDGYCELWYTANTYDLPLHVYFIPEDDNTAWGPDVIIDFTCEKGVYDDPKLDSLINMVSDFDISFPIELMSEPGDLIDGKTTWELSVAKSYREQLAEFGITYPVQAFVKVIFYDAGTITLTPDTTFTSCMENAHHVVLGKAIDIAANDAESVFVFPYTDWQEDSIRFVWEGEGSADVYVAVQECDFEASESNPYVWDHFSITEGAPHKLYSDEMKAAIKAQKEGGLYYAKVVAPSAGKFMVEKIPLSAAEGGALMLEHGTEVLLEDTVYCFPRTWTATQIVAHTAQPVTMYISNTPAFTPSEEDANVLATCVASLEDASRAVYLSGTELSSLVEQAKGDYLYVRFSSPTSTKVAINPWSASQCADQSFMLYPGVQQFIEANSSFDIYRVRYSDFAGYPMTIQWESANTLPIYISETCDYSLTPNNPVLLVNPAISIAAGGEYTIDAATIDSWASRIADDGYFYVRCNPNNPGMLTLLSDRPELPDPIYTEFSVSICHDEAYTWNDITYEKTGSYNQEFVAVNGADSIVTLHLTVFPETPATTEDVTINFGETYEWHGTVYGESDEYTIILQDENGCDYQATLILTVLPEPEPSNPCVAASTLLEPVAQLTISLRDAQDIYRIDYQAWLASGVELIWSGAESLHTFVAEHCEFAVAIYHKKVVNYTEVPAHGNVILSKDILSGLSPYVDEDGYLYIRFLTEFEGQLSVIQPE